MEQKARSNLILRDNLSLADLKRNNHDLTVPTFNPFFTEKKFYYITDIHLRHRLKNYYGNKEPSKRQIKCFISEFVNKMMDAGKVDWYNRPYLLFGGDIADTIELFSFFLSEIHHYIKGVYKKYPLENVIIVLGNHELWDESQNWLVEIIHKYREICRQFDFTFLHNDLFLPSLNSYYSGVFYDKVEEESGQSANSLSFAELKRMTVEDIRKACENCPFVILGGLGFTGYASEKNELGRIYNANHGLYRKAIPDIEQDLIHTKKFESIYRLVVKVLGESKVIVLTHTPMQNWTSDEPHSNWIYVSGHTHRKEYYYASLNKYALIADNQLGYHNEKPELLDFRLSMTICKFMNYPDGIYLITKQEYLEYYKKNLFMSITFNQIGEIYLLKSRGYFLFMLWQKNKLFLLEGGAKRRRKDEKYVNHQFQKVSNANIVGDIKNIFNFECASLELKYLLYYYICCIIKMANVAQ